MTGVSERFDAIESRKDAAINSAEWETTGANDDITDLLDLARKQQAALAAVKALHVFAHTDVEPWAKGYRFSGDHCAYDGERWPCTTIEALEGA